MAKIPEKKELSANAAQIVNSVSKNLNVDGVTVPHVVAQGEMVPGLAAPAAADYALESLRNAGSVITSYEPLANAFLNALYNRIGRVLITSKTYYNPWTVFKRGIMELGDTVEEVFVNLIKAHQFDPLIAETEVFKREKPDVRSAFHTMNYQKFYKTTVSHQQLRQAFLSFDGITNLVRGIIEAIYKSANYDEFLLMKLTFGLRALNGGFTPLAISTPSSANSNAIVTSIKTISDDITELSGEYNEAGVHNNTEKNDQYLILTNSFANLVDVETLAFAFNMDKVTFAGHIIRTKSFGFSADELVRLNELIADNPNLPAVDAAMNAKLKTIPGILIDRNFPMIFDNLTEMHDQDNGQGLYRNYFYHVWKTFSTSPFANAILFTTETPTVTSVTITPATASVQKGTLTNFRVAVVVDGFESARVVWSISGNVSPNTTIDQQGRLLVAKDETAATITVTVTSAIDDTKTDDATVTVL